MATSLIDYTFRNIGQLACFEIFTEDTNSSKAYYGLKTRVGGIVIYPCVFDEIYYHINQRRLPRDGNVYFKKDGKIAIIKWTEILDNIPCDKRKVQRNILLFGLCQGDLQLVDSLPDSRYFAAAAQLKQCFHLRDNNDYFHRTILNHTVIIPKDFVLFKVTEKRVVRGIDGIDTERIVVSYRVSAKVFIEDTTYNSGNTITNLFDVLFPISSLLAENHDRHGEFRGNVRDQFQKNYKKKHNIFEALRNVADKPFRVDYSILGDKYHLSFNFV